MTEAHSSSPFINYVHIPYRSLRIDYAYPILNVIKVTDQVLGARLRFTLVSHTRIIFFSELPIHNCSFHEAHLQLINEDSRLHPLNPPCLTIKHMDGEHVLFEINGSTTLFF